MHDKALINEVSGGSPVERTPWVPHTGSRIANLKGYTVQEMLCDADKLYECCIEAGSQYSPDGMTSMFDLQIEAEILGYNLAWYNNTPPTVCFHPLEGEFVIPTQCIQKTGGCIPLILDVMRHFKAAKPDITMYGLICDPFTLASYLRGANILMDMCDDEDGMKALVAYCEEVVREVANYCIGTGCDIIATMDSLVSQISPDMFETFLNEPYTKFFTSMCEEGIPSSFFACDDATKNIEPIYLTRPDCVTIDKSVDVAEAKKLADAHGVTISGNLQLTITMLLGAQQDSQKAAIELMSKVGTRRFILAPGYDAPLDAPAANFIGVGQAMHNPEAVRKALESYVAKDNLPEIEMPDYINLDYILVEVVTISSKTCATCGYMAATADNAAKIYGDKVKVVERSIMFPENLAFVGEVGLTDLPSLLVNGIVKHISPIPTIERLRKEIEGAMR